LFRRRQYAESTIRTITIATKTPIAMRVPVRLLILRFCPIWSVHSGDIPARWPSPAAILLAVADPEQIAKWARAEQALRASLNGMSSALDGKDASLVEEFRFLDE
jgi:hypothetical protein